MIQRAGKVYPVAAVYRAVGVPRSSYYAWKASRAHAHPKRQLALREVCAIHAQYNQTCGSRRTSEELRRRGHNAGRHRARNLMREAGVQAGVVRTHEYPKGGASATLAPITCWTGHSMWKCPIGSGRGCDVCLDAGRMAIPGGRDRPVLAARRRMGRLGLVRHQPRDTGFTTGAGHSSTRLRTDVPFG